MTRIAKCCGIALDDSEDILEAMYLNSVCRLCGRSVVSAGAGKVVDRYGDEMVCPLCHNGVLGSQLTRHADDLAALQDAASALLTALDSQPGVGWDDGVLEAQKAVQAQLNRHRPYPF